MLGRLSMGGAGQEDGLKMMNFGKSKDDQDKATSGVATGGTTSKVEILKECVCVCVCVCVREKERQYV